MDVDTKDRLDKIEAKLDQLLEFKTQMETMVMGFFSNGGGSRIVRAMTKGMRDEG
jgi:hypothetical protein